MELFELQQPLGAGFHSTNAAAGANTVASAADSVLNEASERARAGAQERLTNPPVQSPFSIDADLDPMELFEIQPTAQATQAPTAQASPVDTPVADITPVPGSEPDPFEIRQTRKQLSSQIRKSNVQSRQVRQELARARQQAISEGRNEDAAAIMQQIQEIANATDGDVENLRDLLQLERSVTPRMSPEDRQAGRDALNAQLPGIRDAFAQQQQERAESQRDQLAAIGGEALALETGLNPDDYMDESLAQFALSASPEVIDHVTRGVGLPAAPGGEQDVARVQALIDQGGVDFGDPMDHFRLDRSAVDRGLTFMGNVEADRAAQETIRDANRSAAVGQAVGGAAQVRDALGEFGIDDPMAAFELTAGGQQGFERPVSIEQEIVNAGATDRPDLVTSARQIDSGLIQGQLRDAVKNQNVQLVDEEITKIGFLLNDQTVSSATKRAVAQRLLQDLEGMNATRDDSLLQTIGSFIEAAMDEPMGAVQAMSPATQIAQAFGSDFMQDEEGKYQHAVVEQQREGNKNTRQINSQLEALRNRLRQIAG